MQEIFVSLWVILTVFRGLFLDQFSGTSLIIKGTVRGWGLNVGIPHAQHVLSLLSYLAIIGDFQEAFA